MLYVYIVCLVFGAAYSAVSAVLGSHGFDHGSFDHGGGVDGHSVGDSADVPSPFNPLVIASAITAFGAFGLIGKAGFKWGDLISTIVALAFAGAVGTIIFFGIVKFMYNSQSNSMFSLDELTGTEAEVTTPVPENGLGEITYVINGERSNLSAKSQDGTVISRGRTVIIREIAGNAAIVQEKLTLDDLAAIDADEEEEKSNKVKKNM